MSYEEDYFFDIPDQVKSKLAIKPKAVTKLVVDHELFEKAKEVETFYTEHCDERGFTGRALRSMDCLGGVGFNYQDRYQSGEDCLAIKKPGEEGYEGRPYRKCARDQRFDSPAPGPSFDKEKYIRENNRGGILETEEMQHFMRVMDAHFERTSARRVVAEDREPSGSRRRFNEDNKSSFDRREHH